VDGLDMFVKGLEEADNVSAKNHALLRLVLILEKGLCRSFVSCLLFFSKLVNICSIELEIIIHLCNRMGFGERLCD
jgi:hypothetical protein